MHTATDLASNGPFWLSPDMYYVIDGDTIGLKGPEKISFRFRSIAAPETTKYSKEAKAMGREGFPLDAGTPGWESREQLKRFTDGRNIGIVPSGKMDKYGRVIADICVYPTLESKDYEAISLERAMIARGVAQRFGDEPLPDRHPLASSTRSTGFSP